MTTLRITPEPPQLPDIDASNGADSFDIISEIQTFVEERTQLTRSPGSPRDVRNEPEYDVRHWPESVAVDVTRATSIPQCDEFDFEDRRYGETCTAKVTRTRSERHGARFIEHYELEVRYGD